MDRMGNWGQLQPPCKDGINMPLEHFHCMEMVVSSLLSALRLKHNPTFTHSILVGDISHELSLGLGFNKKESDLIKKIGYLHDIGKLAISEQILQKPDKLNELEREQIMAHPAIGSKTLQSFGINGKVAAGVLYHHENPDGSGYMGLKDNDIPIEAKIIRIADTFSAMITDRPYRVSNHLITSAIESSRLFSFNTLSQKEIQEYLIDTWNGLQAAYMGFRSVNPIVQF